jgi:hypothetical protein
MWCSCAHGVPVRGLSLGVRSGGSGGEDGQDGMVQAGWLEHLANRDLAHLAHQIRMPRSRRREAEAGGGLSRGAGRVVRHGALDAGTADETMIEERKADHGRYSSPAHYATRWQRSSSSP